MEDAHLRQGNDTPAEQRPATRAWLQPDGRLSAAAAHRDDQTGCLVWAGYLQRGATGPYASLPQSHWPSGHVGPQGPRTQVRQVLWEQRHGPIPPGMFVAARCCNTRCIAPEHADPRSRQKKFSVEQLTSVSDRKAEETRVEAAARLGLHPDTVRRMRGPGGKRPVLASPLRSWLVEHLPNHRQASVDETDWRNSRRYAAGESLQTIADDHGLTRQRVQQRINRLAASLGYHAPTTGTAATGGDHQS